MFPQSAFFMAALVALVDAHGAIINAQGESGSPASVGFRVDPELARNCTAINPCQQDSTLIRDAEIKANIVNTCGRTELGGNIDVGEETENAIAAKKVTQVKPGSTITMTIHQVNADGAGPYACDLDQTSNAGIFQNLSVTDNVPGVNGLSQAKAAQFEVKVTMPNDLNCIGGSTGNICTVRCRNNAQAGPFGGCFAVQQAGKEANVNAPANIAALKDLETVNSQVAQNQKDFPKAVQAIANFGSADAVKAKAEVDSLQKLSVASGTFPVQTPDVVLGNGNAAATPTPAAGNGNNRGNNRGGNNNNNNNNNANNNNNNNNANTGANRNQGQNGANRNQGQTQNGRNGNNAANANGKNNNARRSLSNGLRWAKRMVSPSSEVEA